MRGLRSEFPGLKRNRLMLRIVFSCLTFVLTGIASATDRPNVVLLLADDLGWKDLRCYGGPVRTPALDRLAGSGVRFTDFHSGAAVCSPSRATLLTGRHHVRASIYSWISDNDQDIHLPKSEVTLAEILKDEGYETAHIGKWHLGAPFRGREKPWIDEHGFDYWFATDLNAAPSHRNPTNFWRNRERVGEQEGYACQIVVDDAIRWLDEERDPEKPFFLNVWFHEPHAPIAAPDDIVADYGSTTDPGAIYSGTIDNTDRAIEQLLARLDENTLIIYSSDNGSYRRDRVGELRGSKGSNFEGGIRVPGIFSWPGKIPERRVVDEPAGLIDLLPTVCGLLEIDPPEGVHLDGTNLTPLLTGEAETVERAQPLAWILPLSGWPIAIRDGRYALLGRKSKEYPRDRDAMAELLRQIEEVLAKNGDPDPKATIKSNLFEGFKFPEAERLRGEYIRHNQFHESWIPAIKAMEYEGFELFDLETDIAQQKNLANELPEVYERLKRQLLEITADVMAEGPDWSLPVERGDPMAVLIENACIDCHDRDTKTTLNFEALAFDLTKPEFFRQWEKVHDQIETGAMPPEDKPRPSQQLLEAAMGDLHSKLRETSLAEQAQNGRVPVRRLTRAEYEFTMHDLLGIGGSLALKLPPENMASMFDTVASDQGISPVHIKSYLAAADLALDEAIQLGPKPNMEPRLIDYRNHPYVKMWFERELRQGGNTVKRTADAFVTFDGRPHTTQTDNMGIGFPVAGRYRLSAEVFGYQAKTPVTFCIYRANDIDGKTEMIGSWQIDPGELRKVELTSYFSTEDYFYLVPEDLEQPEDGKTVFHFGAKTYPGEGVGVRRFTLEGPLESEWPPTRTRQLLGELESQQEPLARIAGIVGRVGPRAFRRPLKEGEAALWAGFAKPALDDGREFEAGLHVALRAMLSSPDFLYSRAEPGELDDFALASRLSYFLWKSLPDDRLFLLASEGALRDPGVLRNEVDRMLDDEKAKRFITDFLGQWLELDEIDATRPDEKL